jgi:hypothetical protein
MGRVRDALPGRDEWEHGPVMGTVNAAGGAFTAAAVGHAAELAPVWAAGGGGLAAFAAAVVARRADLSGSSIAYRAACWAAAGGWTARALATTPWDVTNVGMLAGGALVGGLLAPALSRHERREVERAARRLAVTARQARAAEWADRVDRVCRIRGARVPAVQVWEPVDDGPGGLLEPGFTVEVQLPRGGVTVEHIAAAAPALAADADLPEGCGVTVRPGTRRSRVLIDVQMVNVLAREIPYPTDYPLGSCLTSYAIGRRPTGRPASVHTRERSVLLTGPKGGGKSNLLNVFVGRHAEMVDELVWVIDMSGGRLIVPWMRAFLERRATRPPLDWVAKDADEALRMLAAAIRIGQGRGTAYRDLMHAADTDLLPVSARIPQITIVVDESKSITGSNVTDSDRIQIAARLLQVQEELRAMAVNVIRCALRPTGDALGGIDARVQSDVLIMMKPKGEEISKLFDRSAGLRAEDAPYPGSGLLSQDEARPAPFVAYRLTPLAIDRLAVAVSDRRPGLDAPSARLAGVDYATRWDRDRIGWLLTAAAAAVSVGGAGGDAPPPLADGGAGGDEESLADALGRMEASAERLRAEREHDERTRAIDAGLTPDEVDRRWREMAAGWDTDAPPGEGQAAAAGDPAEPAPPAGDRRRTPEQARMLDLLRAAGPAGAAPKALAERLSAEFGRTIHRPTVDGWISQEIAAGNVRKLGRGVYVHRDHAPNDDTE